METFKLFFGLGLQHILSGHDHLLFLAALILVAPSIADLTKVITAFTITHSVTLVLCALNIIRLDPVITEAFIAASILYVGVENVVAPVQRRRWIVAGLFGLVHGSGFSGHLTDLLKAVMSQGGVWQAITGFNLGIEAGQIIVIAILFPLVLWLRRSEKAGLIITELSRAIAATGLVLMVQRIGGT
ncbi:MAG: HupE/UreJ family protein [Rhizobacter sp.]|nr:HupE/UreJ family protein [Chlorobiales bacterium]